MSRKSLKSYTLIEMKDRYIGVADSPERSAYEQELSIEVLGKMIKSTRKERQLTQEVLGRLIGVQKAQISKLESNANSATIETILKVFKALNAELHFNVTL